MCFVSRKLSSWGLACPDATQLTWIGAVRAKAAFPQGFAPRQRHASRQPRTIHFPNTSALLPFSVRGVPPHPPVPDLHVGCPLGLRLGQKRERERGSGIAATRYPMKRIAVCCLQVIELSRSCGSCSENISTRLLYQYLNNYLYSKRPSYTFGGACITLN